MIRKATILMITAAMVSSASFAEVQKLVVPLSDPDRPVELQASLLFGGITVEAYDGSEILVEASTRENGSDVEEVQGMYRIPNTSLGLTVEENNNRVRISSDWTTKGIDLALKVPRKTSVELGCTNDGDIRVKGLEGKHELQNVNGSITAQDVSGSVVAHTTNGPIKVTFASIESQTSMSFVGFNGDVDVTFPPGLAADLKMSSGQGEIYTDFQVELQARQATVEGGSEKRTDQGRERSRYRVRIEREVQGQVGGGGPEMRFSTFNGDIYIRKSGS